MNEFAADLDVDDIDGQTRDDVNFEAEVDILNPKHGHDEEMRFLLGQYIHQNGFKTSAWSALGNIQRVSGGSSLRRVRRMS